MELNLITSSLLKDYIRVAGKSPLETLDRLERQEMAVDYFQFYKAVSSVYSSKIEGEEIDFDSFFKHKFLSVPFKTDYTKKADDLFAAYEFIDDQPLNFANVQKAHAILSANLLPASEQGRIRTNPMFVIGSNDQIEYVAAGPAIVKDEVEKLFTDIEHLRKLELNEYEVFYYAALIHLVFVKIHPFQDGNGRTARLMEKWFLWEKLGEKAVDVQLEKNYFLHLQDYYDNIKKLGLEYETLDYSKALDFLLMTVKGIG
ncbi:MAG: hypothetical protein Roseis3KO_24300 [Roseivirga sp.]